MNEKLHEFRKQYYTAQAMTLVVQSQETLEKLEEIVIEMFSKIPNNGLSQEKFINYEQPFDFSKFHKMYKIVPLNNDRKVYLIWSLPSLRDKYMFKIFKYLRSIIAHKGKGSLLLFLKKHNWATSLCVSEDTRPTHSIFQIEITFTKEGLENLDQVLSAVFR